MNAVARQLTILFSAWGVVLAGGNQAQCDQPRPNFVLIIGDDISVNDFGCYGHPHIRTPNVDRLAAGGLRFTNAYLTTSQCSPTRCSVISGRYPHNTGAPELHLPLPEDLPMFPQELKQAGYHTAASGKWHLGPHARSAFDRINRGKPGGEERWLECLEKRPRDQPFLMWFASFDAHRQWQPDPAGEPHQAADAVIPPFMADQPGTQEDLAAYYDEIGRLDRYVGLVVDKLREQEVLDNTVIFFMADNGRPFPRCKTWLYDSGIKTPLVVHWPDGIEFQGGDCDSLVSAIDLAPTILGLAGVEPPPTFQGVSFAPAFRDLDHHVREYAFAEHNWHDMEAHERMVRWQDWTYIRNARPQLAGWAHAHADEKSYLDLLKLQKAGRLTPAQAEAFRAPRPAEMLFNVENDPHQLVNLADSPEHRQVLQHLSGTLDRWQSATGDTVPEDLTGDIIDRETLQWIHSPGQTPRGTPPGTERQAVDINAPGPR